MPAMTKLEAVNEMLLAIGQAPVNTLEVAGIRDVSIAEQMLDNVSREVQSQGHIFNTFTEEVTPDVNGFIPVPNDVMHIDATDPTVHVTTRYDTNDDSTKLYDLDEKTFVFGDQVEVEKVLLIDFERIPQYARRYIVAMAKLRFQASVVGSAQLNNLIEQELGMAYAEFRKAELYQQDNNILTAGGTIISRNRYRLRRY